MKKDAIFTRGRKRSKDWPRCWKITQTLSFGNNVWLALLGKFSNFVVHPISSFRIRSSLRSLLRWFKTKPLTFICWPGVCRRSKCYLLSNATVARFSLLSSKLFRSAACCWRISVTLPWIIEVTWLLATTYYYTKGGGLINHMHCCFYTRPGQPQITS